MQQANFHLISVNKNLENLQYSYIEISVYMQKVFTGSYAREVDVLVYHQYRLEYYFWSHQT